MCNVNMTFITRILVTGLLVLCFGKFVYFFCKFVYF